MKIIVGLGNPGKDLQNTRHSLGFSVLGYLAKKYGGNFEFDKNLESEISEIKIAGKKVLLAKPQTFMNNSGQAIRKLVKNLKFKVPDLAVVHDDLDIPFGKTKLSFGRSSAGHKGVESVVKALKTDKFYRIRIGTFDNQLAKIRKMKDKKKRLQAMNKFVLGSFSPSEKSKAARMVKQAAEKAVSI